MKAFPVLLIFSQLLSLSYAQDTIRPDPRISYSRQTDPHRGKEFASKARYAKEEIVYSENKKTIEYCYYYDGERICFGNTYEIVEDSILKIDDAAWNFKKTEVKYLLSRFHKGVYESGMASQLIPLQTIGVFTSTTSDKRSILWTTDYAAVIPGQPFDRPEYSFHQTGVTGKIYDSASIDEMPVWADGSTLNEISLKRDDERACYGEPLISRLIKITFIITTAGDVVNFKQTKGNLDIAACPYYFMALIRHISTLGPVRPAKKKGKPVNTSWTVNIESL